VAPCLFQEAFPANPQPDPPPGIDIGNERSFRFDRSATVMCGLRIGLSNLSGDVSAGQNTQLFFGDLAVRRFAT
jgi:hypothetical protein